MWLEDVRNGLALTIAHQQRIGIRGLPPGGKDEVELGWFGWSLPKDLSRDGKQVLFEEEGEGGGPNYTVFLRDTDGSPPVKIGEGRAEAISPDKRWVITQSTQDTGLRIVPTGAGVARELTHGDIRFISVRYLPDGKQLLATGIESGHGARDYLIDVSTGNAKPITPEGVTGTQLSPDGRGVIVIGPDGRWGIWSLGGGDMRIIPGLDPKFAINGWAPDGNSVYATSSADSAPTAKVYRIDVATGKTEYWKTFGENIASGVVAVSIPRFSTDGSAYEYFYVQLLSQAYVVKGLK
jgi:Tol biopolymer transport system component